MTEEYIATVLVYRALLNLHRTNPAWGKNVEIYQNMLTDRRVHWWAQAQKQAALGVPAMQELVSAVILLRLTS